MEEIHIIWQFGGTLLQSEQNVSISSLTFVIPEGPDEIWFQCLMSNQYGCDQKSIAITIITGTCTCVIIIHVQLHVHTYEGHM